MQNTASSKPYSLEALIGEIKAHDIISFDIYDTLIMRKVYVNKDIIRLLALRFSPVLREDFYAARTQAQATLCTGTYPYIEAIYDETARLCPSIKGYESELIAAEIALEKSKTVPRSDVIMVFETAKQLGKMVNIVSDMYFHQETMCSILQLVGISGYHKLLVSSEYKTGKPQHLFEKYLEEIPSSKCLHIGDSWDCDIFPARKLGIDTFRLKMSSEIYEHTENTIAPADLFQRTQIAEYIAEEYNSPFSHLS